MCAHTQNSQVHQPIYYQIVLESSHYISSFREQIWLHNMKLTLTKLNSSSTFQSFLILDLDFLGAGIISSLASDPFFPKSSLTKLNLDKNTFHTIYQPRKKSDIINTCFIIQKMYTRVINNFLSQSSRLATAQVINTEIIIWCIRYLLLYC